MNFTALFPTWSESRFSLGHHLNWAVLNSLDSYLQSCCSMQYKPVNICLQMSTSFCLVFGHGLYCEEFNSSFFRKSGLFEKALMSYWTLKSIQEANSSPPKNVSLCLLQVNQMQEATLNASCQNGRCPALINSWAKVSCTLILLSSLARHHKRGGEHITKQDEFLWLSAVWKQAVVRQIMPRAQSNRVYQTLELSGPSVQLETVGCWFEPQPVRPKTMAPIACLLGSQFSWLELGDSANDFQSRCCSCLPHPFRDVTIALALILKQFWVKRRGMLHPLSKPHDFQTSFSLKHWWLGWN